MVRPCRTRLSDLAFGFFERVLVMAWPVKSQGLLVCSILGPISCETWVGVIGDGSVLEYSGTRLHSMVNDDGLVADWLDERSVSRGQSVVLFGALYDRFEV